MKTDVQARFVPKLFESVAVLCVENYICCSNTFKTINRHKLVVSQILSMKNARGREDCVGFLNIEQLYVEKLYLNRRSSIFNSIIFLDVRLNIFLKMFYLGGVPCTALTFQQLQMVVVPWWWWWHSRRRYLVV